MLQLLSPSSAPMFTTACTSVIDVNMMEQALIQAEIALKIGEVPVGAVVATFGGEIIGRGYNRTIIDVDPTAHAEIVALREAARHIANYRLPGMSLYVTLEPCVMCIGAMLHARLGRVVFGATDLKTGACGSQLDITSLKQLNHQTRVNGGILAEPCGHLLRAFFRDRRKGC